MAWAALTSCREPRPRRSRFLHLYNTGESTRLRSFALRDCGSLHQITMRLLAPSTLLRSSSRSLVPAVQRVPHLARFQSTAPSSNEPTIASLSPRWLSDLKARIGRCILFGLSPEQTNAAGVALQELTTDWRDLVAGSEGFLTGKGRMGLYRQEVVWGEMVSSPSPILLCNG